MKTWQAWIQTTAAIFVAVVPAYGGTLKVPSEYRTINTALDAASPGDTVLVAPGTYSDFEIRTFIGPVSACAFLSAGVLLKSEGGPGVTTLDRQGVETLAGDYTILGIYSHGAAVEGFRITGNPPEAAAVGLVGLASNPPLVTFRDCDFAELTSVSNSAMAASNASVSLSGCRFLSCHGDVGGVVEQFEAHMIVENSLFENCSPTALRCEGGPSVAETLVVRNSIFRNNTAEDGGAIISNNYNGGVVIESCLFEGNRASSEGGAIVAIANGPIQLRENVFIDNRAEGEAFSVGGAVVLANGVGSLAVVEGNTFIASHQGHPSGGAALRTGAGAIVRSNVFAGSTGAPAVYVVNGLTEERCNLFWNNAAGDAVGFTPDSTDVFADPQFCNPDAGDFTVSSTSPCAPGNTPYCDQIGALGVGCGMVSVESMSWGRLKARFRANAEE